MWFLYTIQYVPGKELYTPDTLSRAPLPEQGDILQSNTLKETELFVEAMIESLPAHKDRLNEYRQNQAKDTICSQSVIIYYFMVTELSHLPLWELKHLRKYIEGTKESKNADCEQKLSMVVRYIKRYQ